MGSSSAPQESFVLRWSEFQANIATSFQELREDEDFFDVTVACDAEHQLSAHKVVLAASSGFFRGLLKRNPARHPVLVMPPNVRFEELETLIDFMYHGEVSILQDQIESFMRLAEMFKVKGLVEDMATAPKPPRLPKLPQGINVARRRPSETAMHPQAMRSPQPQPPPPAQPQVIPGVKRPRLHPPHPQPQQQQPPARPRPAFAPTHSEDEDEVRELPGGGDPHDFAGYSSGEHSAAAASSAAPATGTRFVALQCPCCPEKVPGVDAFKHHMFTAHGMGNPPSATPSGTPTSAASTSQMQSMDQYDSEEMAVCSYCDKAFKGPNGHKNMVSHQRRVHRIGAKGALSGDEAACGSTSSMPGQHHQQDVVVKKRGRPPKNPPPADSMAMYHDSAASASASPTLLPKPVGQVIPSMHVKQEASAGGVAATEVGVPADSSDSPQRLPRPTPPPGFQRGQPPTQPPRPAARPSAETGVPAHLQRGPAFQPQGLLRRDLDLANLGKKLGSQISITSSEQSNLMRRAAVSAGMGVAGAGVGVAVASTSGEAGPSNTSKGMSTGVSITKMKSDETAGLRQQQPQQHLVEVKDEPEDGYDEEDVGEEEDNYHGEDMAEDDYDETAYEAGYGDPDYEDEGDDEGVDYHEGN